MSTLQKKGESRREELELASPFPCCPVIPECEVKQNPDRKEKWTAYQTLSKVNILSATTLVALDNVQSQSSSICCNYTNISSQLKRAETIMKILIKNLLPMAISGLLFTISPKIFLI